MNASHHSNRIERRCGKEEQTQTKKRTYYVDTCKHAVRHTYSSSSLRADAIMEIGKRIDVKNIRRRRDIMRDGRTLYDGVCRCCRLLFASMAGVVSRRNSVGTPFPLFSVFRTLNRRHCDPFSRQKCTTLRDFAYRLQS